MLFVLIFHEISHGNVSRKQSVGKIMSFQGKTLAMKQYRESRVSRVAFIGYMSEIITMNYASYAAQMMTRWSDYVSLTQSSKV